MDHVNVGIIGAGRIGRVHARNLQYLIPETDVIMVSDVSHRAASKLASELAIPDIVEDYTAVLKNKEVDAVVICSPTSTHADIICEAAAFGKHIFCEKPIALEMKKIDKAISDVERAGIKLVVGFNRRYDPSFQKARELIEQGEIGKPTLVKITSRDPEPPPVSYIEKSGGLFLDMTIHDFDMARYLMGEEVKEIMAYGDCLVFPQIGKAGDIDTAIISLRYESGAMGVIDNSRQSSYGYDNRIEVLGTEGSVMVGHRKPTAVTVNNDKGLIKEKPLYFFMERYQEAYIAEAKDFVRAIIEDKNPLASGEDGKIAVQMGYAANDSLKSNKYVKVPKYY